MTETIFGKKIIDSYRLEEALKNKSGLMEVASDNNINGLNKWAEHMRVKDIPYIIIYRTRHTTRFALLKQGYIYNVLTGEDYAKKCTCNPLTKDGCIKCKPRVTGKRQQKTLNWQGDSDDKKTDTKKRKNCLQLLARGKGRIKANQGREAGAC